jgi:hypothetical protein
MTFLMVLSMFVMFVKDLVPAVIAFIKAPLETLKGLWGKLTGG